MQTNDISYLVEEFPGPIGSKQPAGLYASQGRALYWDGQNRTGEQVASGVYYYTLRAGTFTISRRMLISK